MFAVGSLAGCKVTAEDIDYWRRTVKGPTKLVRVMLSDHYDVELRSRAAAALVEMERNDVEGLALLQDALTALRQSDRETSEAIVQNMAPRLVQLMSGTGETGAAQQQTNGRPPPQQTRAKDAAYIVIPYANDATRQVLMAAVVDWYVQDFVNRNLEGNYSAEQVVRTLGAPAAARLLAALNAQMPQQALVKIAELIAQLGDSATKTQAAERLVAIEREMESETFLNWLKGEIRAQMSAGGTTPSEDRVMVVATLNRENWINDGAVTAMRYLSSQAAITTRLMEIASAKPAEGTNPTIAEHLNQRRVKALQALEGMSDDAHLDALFVIALDPTAPTDVRDVAFDRISDLRSQASIPRLWPLLEGGADNVDLAKRLRGRAGQLILAAGGPAIVPEFLRRLPAATGIEYEHAELSGYALRLSQMTSPPTDLMRQQLNAPRWWNRVIALYYFQRRGTQADIARLEAKRSDAMPTAGDNWDDMEPAGTTVGRVAENALRGLRERLTAESAPTAEGAAGGDSSMAPAGGDSAMAPAGATMAP